MLSSPGVPRASLRSGHRGPVDGSLECWSEEVAGLVMENHPFLLLSLLQQEPGDQGRRGQGDLSEACPGQGWEDSKEGCSDLSVSSGCPYCVSDEVGVGLARILCLSYKFLPSVYLLLRRPNSSINVLAILPVGHPRYSPDTTEM